MSYSVHSGFFKSYEMLSDGVMTGLDRKYIFSEIADAHKEYCAERQADTFKHCDSGWIEPTGSVFYEYSDASTSPKVWLSTVTFFEDNKVTQIRHIVDGEVSTSLQKIEFTLRDGDDE